MKRSKKPKAIVYVPDAESDFTGCFAISNNGHHADRLFLVLGACGDGFVLVADGKYRSAVLPKRKNLKHLTLLGKDETAAKLIRGGNVTDSEIRRMINQKRRNSENKSAYPKA